MLHIIIIFKQKGEQQYHKKNRDISIMLAATYYLSTPEMLFKKKKDTKLFGD